jgi:hypothetical protein
VAPGAKPGAPVPGAKPVAGIKPGAGIKPVAKPKTEDENK